MRPGQGTRFSLKMGALVWPRHPEWVKTRRTRRGRPGAALKAFLRLKTKWCGQVGASWTQLGCPGLAAPPGVGQGAQNQRGRLGCTLTSMEARLAREMRDYLAENYNQPVELRRLSDEWHYSETAILRQFRLAWGLTPREFVEAMRLNEARRLLTHTDMPVQDVCLTVGYCSVPSFVSLFRAKYGATPLAYRAAQQQFWLGWSLGDLRRIPACFLRFGNLR